MDWNYNFEWNWIEYIIIDPIGDILKYVQL